MARLRDLFKKVSIRSDNAAPQGAKMTGKMHRGKPIYIERKQKFVNRQKEIGGDLQWIERNGRKIAPMMERVPDPDEPFVEREFVLEDMGNGILQKNYHFEGPEVVPVLSDEEQRIKELERQVKFLTQHLSKKALKNMEPATVDPEFDDLGILPDGGEDADLEALGLTDDEEKPLQVAGTKGRGARERKSDE